MKLISYRDPAGETFGAVVGDGIVNLGRAAEIGCASLRAALTAGVQERMRRFAAEHAPDTGLADVTVLPPIPDPPKIICVGLNYTSHAAEGGREPPKYPSLFPRYANTQVGHGQPLIRPKVSEQFDFEGEFAFVIGKAGRHIGKERAYAHVAGYSCYVDASVRDWQRHTGQYLPGKNFVGSGGFGPWLVTADEIPDPSALTLTTRLNGEEVQHAGLDDLIFDVPTLVEYISTFTELEPGDVISTGTPSGVGAYRKPPLWMKPGDTLEVEITGLGILRHPIAAEKA